MLITPIPVRRDNYVYAIAATHGFIVVDAGDAAPIMAFCEAHERPLTHVLLTHFHADHTHGVNDLRRETGCQIIAPPEAPFVVDTTVADDQALVVDGIPLQVIFTPGHSPDDVCYYCPARNAVFTGDALFAGGCGRLLNGTAEQLWASLKLLRALPPDTEVYCGHEYAMDNVAFACALEPENEAARERLKRVWALRSEDRPAVPSRLREECATNPFLRADDDAIKQAVDMPGADPAAVFAELRRRKDGW